MASIDDKVVAMSFESSKFEQGVNRTIAALDKLKGKLTFPNAGKGLDQLNASAKRVDLSHIASGVESIKSKLGALRLAGIALFANLASKAVAAGAQFVKSFTLQPILQGFQEYSTNLNAVQTILANTQASGAKLKDVNAALKDLNTYSDKTIYNFSEMAKNIGTFTAAGVDLKTSTAAIKGIANLAALSGSNSQQASTAMYQLSQAIAAGRVSLQDWNSVVNAGMGGTVFQRALAQTAVKMGTLSDGAVKLTGKMKNVTIGGESFRNSITAKPGEKSWLTSEVLTKTLSHFTGDLSDAQLAAEGFNKAEIKAIQAQAKTAMNAATQVKTLQQVFDVAKETMGSGWAQTFQTIFGDFGEAKTTFTALSNAINGFINASANARNKVLGDWKALGGRKILIDALKTAFKDLVAVIKPIKDAFREIFPAKTGKDLYNATVAFKNFVDQLKPSPETVNNLKRTFAGLFAVLDIGKQIVGGIFTVLGKLFGEVGKGSGGFLSITASIGDFLVKVDQALKKGDRLHNFFALLGAVIAAPIKVISQFAQGLSRATGTMHPLQSAIDGVAKAWAQLTGQAQKSQGVLTSIGQSLVQYWGQVGQILIDTFQNMNFDQVLNAIEVGLIGGLVLMFKKFAQGGFDNLIFQGLFKSMTGTFGGLTFALKGLGGAFNGISQVLGGLTGNLQAMQQKTKAEALKQIAIAIALIAASAVALSLVDPKKLNSSLSALTIMLGQLLGAMAILDKIGKSGGFIKMPIIAASMVMLAGAIDLLTLAVMGLARLNWSELSRGLLGISVLLAGISVVAKPLSANSAGLIRAGVGITAIAVGLNVLALAVRQFGSMDMATLGKGLGGVALGLIAVGAAARVFPSGMIQIGAGLVVVAGGLLLLSKAVSNFGNMQWSQIAKGIGGIGAALLAIGVSMRLMPRNMVMQAAAIGVVALALQGIAKAVTTFGGMSLTQIAKGLGVLAASLVILAVALAGMTEALPGAAALAVAAGGIALLAPALESLGKQSWGQILKGLVSLAAAFVVLGVAGAVLAPVAPALLALGAALTLIGAGLALAGAGIALIGVGLSAIAVSGPVAIGILVKSIQTFLTAIPKVATAFVNGLLSIVQKIAETAPKFVAAIIKIVDALVSAIPPLAPKLATALIAILLAAIKVLSAAFPRLVEAGAQMIISLLKGISNHISEVTRMVVTIIGKFLNGVANNLSKIVGAGANILVKLLQGIANNIGKVVTAAGNIIAKFVTGIGNNAAKVATAGANALAKFINAIANGYGRVISAGTNLIVKLVNGIGNASQRIINAGVNAITKFINAISKGAVKLVNTGFKAVINFLNGVADAIRNHEGEMIAAGANIGEAIVQGMINGLGNLAGRAISKAASIGKSVLHALGKAVHLGSPSKETFKYGQWIVEGLANGMDDTTAAVASATAMGNSVIGAFKDVFQITSPSRVMINIGKQVNAGFAQGLMGTTDQIKSAFNDLNQKVADGMRATRDTIAAEQQKLNQLRSQKHRDAQAIREVTKELNANKKELVALTGAHSELSKGLDKEKTKLLGLAKDYANVTKQLDDATSVLKDAIKTRDDFAASITDKYAAVPDIVTTDQDGNPIDPAAQVQAYENQLAAQAGAVATFKSTLDQLRALGMDDKTYQKLLSDGTADQQFASALLAGGRTAVQGLNALDAQLDTQAQALGSNSARDLYQAGVDAAQGLVNGLKSQQDSLRKQMEALVKIITSTIRKKLRMKSPSQVFFEIGQLTMEGMAQGLSDSSKMVTDAVAGVADDAVSAMQSSIKDVHTAITAEIDPNPTITPVLDLTNIQNGSKNLASIFGTTPIGVVSLGQAAAISADQQAAQLAKDAEAQSFIKFEQNNYSPESLSPIEIYRQTKNQLAQARPVLAQ